MIPIIQQEFSISTDYAYTKIYPVIQGIDFSSCVAPKGKNFGESLETDRTGRAEGQLIIADTFGLGILTKPGDVTINWIVDEGDSAVSGKIAAITTYKVVIPGQATRTPIDISSGSKPISDGITGFTNSPMAQTFFIDGSKYINGVFVTSAEVFFATKSANSAVDVKVQLREVVNGIPSQDRVIDGSYTNVQLASINVPANISNGPNLATKFRFHYPIYLEPGKEFALCVIPPDSEYSIFINKPGDEKLSTSATSASTVSNKQPGVGKLFKISNTGAPIEQTGSILFKINKAVFETGTKTFVKENAGLPTKFYYSKLNVVSNQKVFGDEATVGYEFSGYQDIFGSTGFNPINRQVETEFQKILYVQSAGDAKVRVTLNNKNKDISPVVDVSGMSLITTKNEIDAYSNEIRNSELLPSNGFAKAKYISKVVSLSPDFDSTGLEVKLQVNRKLGTDIDVYCRVLSSLDNALDSKIDRLPWRLMPLYNTANTINFSEIVPAKLNVGSSSVDFINETYRILETDSVATTGTANLSYTASVGGVNTTFNTFNKFQVKIVLYGSLTTQFTPKVKNLIATSVF